MYGQGLCISELCMTGLYSVTVLCMARLCTTGLCMTSPRQVICLALDSTDMLQIQVDVRIRAAALQGTVFCPTKEMYLARCKPPSKEELFTLDRPEGQFMECCLLQLVVINQGAFFSS